MSNFSSSPAASVYSNGEFILIMTLSGRGMMRYDSAAPVYNLSAEVADEEVGTAVLSALSMSREIEVDNVGEFFDLERSKAEYEDWVSEAMRFRDIKTRRAFFKGMMNCGVRGEGGAIKFEPMRKVKLEAWQGTSSHGEDDVLVNIESRPFDVGVALRTALSRCR